MDYSVFLAQVFGLYFILAGTALLIQPNAIPFLLRVLGTRESVYLTGFLTLMIGIPLVLVHNIWDGSWRVIITSLAWLALGKGLIRIFFPDLVVTWAEGLGRQPKLVRHLVWIMIVLGLYLIYVGFGLIDADA